MSAKSGAKAFKMCISNLDAGPAIFIFILYNLGPTSRHYLVFSPCVAQIHRLI